MKDFEHIGKQMPYRETEDYLQTLINHSTETALNQSHHRRPTLGRPVRLAAAAAIAALLVVTAIAIYPSSGTQQTAQVETASPLDQFLGSITDEEAQLLAYYEVEDMDYDLETDSQE